MKTVGLICFFSVTVVSGLAAPTAAQIFPDGTTRTKVQPNLNIRGIPSDLIKGGTVRRNTLFQSFQEFNIKTRRGAYFANPNGIKTIFSRVTGRNASNLDGTLGVLGPADLFFLNPNGIVFGPNARLDLSGSFTASTATEFRFSDGLTFSATKPQAAPLLTVNLVPGAQLGESVQGDIANAGQLEVAGGRSLTLHGNNIEHTGLLKAPSGTVGLFGQTVGILDQARIDVSGAEGGGTALIGGSFQGAIPQFNAKRTFVGPDTQIQANALRNGNGGSVVVWSNEVTGFYGNIQARGAGLFNASKAANGGNVEVSSQEHLIFRGAVDTTTPGGQPGTVLLDPTTITIANGTGESGLDGSDSFSGDQSGLAGQILSAPLSQINDAAPTTIFESELEELSGNTDVILQATDGITIEDLADNELQFKKGTGLINFSGDANQDGIGDVVVDDPKDTLITQGRNVMISGGNVRLGTINTQGYGGDIDGGNVLINASRRISANDIVTSTSHVTDRESAPIQVGQGGDIQLISRGDVKTRDLVSGTVGRSENGSITGGQGGDISLLSTSGAINTGRIISSSQTDSSVGDITGADGGRISVNAQGDIQVGLVSSPSSQVSQSPNDQSSVSGGNGGPISISTQTGNIFLSGNVDSFALSTGSAGSGGNITIAAENGAIAGPPPVASSGFELTQLRSFSLAKDDPQESSFGGQVSLAAKHNLTNLELFPFSSPGEPGTVNIQGTGDTLLNNLFVTNIVTAMVPNQVLAESLLDEFEGTQRSGAINISGKGNLTFREGIIDSGTFGSNDAGDITIESPSLIIFESNSFIESGANSAGNAGNVNVTAPKIIIRDKAIISTSTGFEGKGGTISVTTDELKLASGGEILAFTSGKGDGGEINIQVNSPAGVVLSGQDTSFSATTDYIGNAGSINVISPKIVLEDTANIATFTLGQGKGGTLSLTTDELRLSSGSKILGFTTDNGDGGAVNIQVNSPAGVVLSGQDTSFSVTTNSFGNAGNIDINAPQIVVRQGAEINVGTLAQGNAGAISLETDELRLSQGGKILAFTSGDGNGGSIDIHASRIVDVGEGVQDFTPVISVETNGAGQAGDITIETPQFNLAQTARITATATATGTAGGGNILLSANQLNLGGVVGIFAETQGAAPAGTLTLQPYSGDSELSVNLNSGTQVSASTSGSGQGGDLILKAPKSIAIAGAGQLSVETSNSGDAGNIELSTRQLTLTDGVSLSASTSGSGTAGDIDIVADELKITNGAIIQTSTSGAGDAGTIKLDVAQNLLLDQGAIAASTSAGSTGRGGEIDIDPIQTTLRNSRISVNSQGQGVGGNISVISDQLALEQGSSISAATASTDGGNIQLQIDEVLTLENASQITATAGIGGGAGAGGNVEVDADFVLAFPEGQNQIVAEAFEGDGGNIEITTNAILGDRFLDISASSNLGLDGEVNIETPGVDPSKSLTQLPTTVVDPNPRIANACTPQHQGQSQFVVAGRGGLPRMPQSRPRGTVFLADLDEDQRHLGLNLTRESQPLKLASIGHQLEVPASIGQHLQSGTQAYHEANYAQAIRDWTHAVQQLANGHDPVAYASTLSHLALGYHVLGDWHKAELALATSQKTLTPQLQDQYPQLQAQILNTQARLALAKGDAQSALEDWQHVAQLYSEMEHASGTMRVQLNQAQALRSLGYFRQAQSLLIPLTQALTSQPPSAEQAMALLQLGDLFRASGDVPKAQTTLEQAHIAAQSLHQPDLTSAILMTLGHTVQTQSEEKALSYYQQAVEIAPTTLAQFQSRVSQLKLLATTDPTTARALWAKVQYQAQSLPVSRESLYTQLFLVDTVLHQDWGTAPTVMKILGRVEQQAQGLGDSLARSYALGYRGRLQRKTGDGSGALSSTHQALTLARKQQAPEAVYQWAWQLGRYRAEQGDRKQAMTAYGEAIEALRSVRGDLAIASEDVQFSFRDGVEPLYRQYVKLLLESGGSQGDLLQARTLIEELQLSELNDYFQDACTQSTPVIADQLDPTAAVIYPIVLEDRVDVIVRIGTQPLRHYSTPTQAGQVDQTVNALLRSFSTPLGSQQPQNTQQLQQVYNWIIGPVAQDLAQQQIETLVFVADGALRTLPLGALHDGQQYLIENYQVALSPGLDLLPPSNQDGEESHLLIGGMSEARPGFPALPFVPQEVDGITAHIPDHQRLLNQDLTLKNLSGRLTQSSSDIVHLATHGVFAPSAEETFLLTWDGQLSIDDMATFFQRRRGSSASPIDLLVLSACQTATGDSRAVLGIAGMTIRSGVRSTIAGLWSLNDQASATFMEQFYQALAQPTVNKGEAFRQAQLALMKDPRFAAPYYWSPFVLVGSWQ